MPPKNVGQEGFFQQDNEVDLVFSQTFIEG